MEKDARYLTIARDINEKILKGTYKVGDTLRGRTILASEYGVSSETIRKAVSLLDKEKIVEVKHGVGIFVNSKENAKRFKEKCDKTSSIHNKEDGLKQLLKEKDILDKKLHETFEELMGSYKFHTNEIIKFDELIIPDSSWVIGNTVGDIYFYNYTESTIVAIIRKEEVFTSPGPDFKLNARDKLVLVGKDELSFERALAYVLYGVLEE